MSDHRFREQLDRQLGFLERSCQSFDQGHRDEAIRIATSIRILIHDTRTSTSLLSHLEAKSIRLLSTAQLIDNPERVFSFDGLTSFSANGPQPKLGRTASKTEMSVSAWWEQVIYVAGELRLGRRDLVLGAANKDGGAHVDAELGPEYEKVATDFWIRYSRERSETALTDIHLIGLRQLGYEVLNSPELIALRPLG